MAGTNTPKDFATKTASWLQDKVGRVPADDLAAFVDDAVKQYSADRPYEKVTDVVGNGTNDLALPPDFVDGWSELRQVEFPVDQIPELIVDKNEAYLFRKASGLVLRLLHDKPTGAQSVRVTYSTYHIQGTDPSTFTTISDADFPTVCALAASFAAVQMAGSYAQGIDGLTDSVLIDGQTRNTAEREAAKELRGIYDRHMGLGTPDVPVSAHGQGFADIDNKLLGVTEPLTHPSRWT